MKEYDIKFQRDYYEFGRDMIFHYNDVNYPLKNLPESGINYFLNFKCDYLSILQRKDWWNIFQSELIHRRNMKINKIRNKIGHTK